MSRRDRRTAVLKLVGQLQPEATPAAILAKLNAEYNSTVHLGWLYNALIYWESNGYTRIETKPSPDGKTTFYYYPTGKQWPLAVTAVDNPRCGGA